MFASLIRVYRFSHEEILDLTQAQFWVYVDRLTVDDDDDEWIPVSDAELDRLVAEKELELSRGV